MQYRLQPTESHFLATAWFRITHQFLVPTNNPRVENPSTQAILFLNLTFMTRIGDPRFRKISSPHPPPKKKKCQILVFLLSLPSGSIVLALCCCHPLLLHCPRWLHDDLQGTTRRMHCWWSPAVLPTPLRWAHRCFATRALPGNRWSVKAALS